MTRSKYQVAVRLPNVAKDQVLGEMVYGPAAKRTAPGFAVTHSSCWVFARVCWFPSTFLQTLDSLTCHVRDAGGKWMRFREIQGWRKGGEGFGSYKCFLFPRCTSEMRAALIVRVLDVAYAVNDRMSSWLYDHVLSIANFMVKGARDRAS